MKSTRKERQEKVLKFFLCRKCLKAANKVKHERISDCKAPDCGICGKNHHKLICPEEEREQKTHKIDEDDKQEDDDDQQEYPEDQDLFAEDLTFNFA